MKKNSDLKKTNARMENPEKADTRQENPEKTTDNAIADDKLENVSGGTLRAPILDERSDEAFR